MSDLICLLVDDEPSIRTFLRAILERERFNCLEAEDATRALRIAQKLGGRIDLIISDIKMPGEMDGLDLAHSIRNTYPDLPVILISGYTEEDVLQRSSGVFQFIQKPFVPETILRAARKAVGVEQMCEAAHGR
jgi:DNA-binding NtrC family response regulator